jgi:hypothetical protein
MPILVLEDDSAFDNNHLPNSYNVRESGIRGSSSGSSHNNNNNNHRYVEDHRTHKDIRTLIVEDNDSMDDLVCTSFPPHPVQHHSHSSFPSVQELRTDMKIIRRNCWNRWTNLTNKKKRQCAISLTCLVLFFALICSIPSMKRHHEISSSYHTTTGVQNSIDSNERNSNSTSSSSGTKRNSEYFDVEYLSSNDVSEMNMMIRVDTYQYQAVNWLANHDAMNLPVPTTNIQSYEGYMYAARYILALNYFALGGPQWDNPYHFLSPQSVCLWNKQQKIYNRKMSDDDLSEAFLDAGLICTSDIDTKKDEPMPAHMYLSKLLSRFFVVNLHVIF